MSSIKKITHRARRVLFTPPGATRPVIAELTPERLTFKEYRRHKGSGPSLNLADLHNIAQRFHSGELWSGGELAECMGDASKLAVLRKLAETFKLEMEAATTMIQRGEARYTFSMEAVKILTGEDL